MNRIKVSVLLALLCFILASAGQAVSRPKVTLGTGGGLLAGMYAVSGELMFPVLDPANSFLRLSGALTDSQSVSNMPWRRFAPISLDYLYYFANNKYFGLGFNHPIKVSDAQTGGLGFQSMLGMEFKLANGLYYGELGYMRITSWFNQPFDGLYAVFGYRMVLVD